MPLCLCGCGKEIIMNKHTKKFAKYSPGHYDKKIRSNLARENPIMNRPGVSKKVSEKIKEMWKDLNSIYNSESYKTKHKEASNQRKGKTYEQLFGPEKAKELIDQRSGDKAWTKRPEVRKKTSISGLARHYHHSPEMIKHLSEQKMGDLNPSKRPEVRSRISNTVTELWKDEGYRKKQTFGIIKGLCPHSEQEYYVNYLLQKIYPNEFIHNIGKDNINDQKFVAHKVPDFYHKSLPILIEIFGDYWHSKKFTGKEKENHEQEMINHYKKSGYDCLVFWECEVNGSNFEQLLIERISTLLIKITETKKENIEIKMDGDKSYISS